MKNFDWLVYTYKHRRTIEYLIQELPLDEALRNEMLERAKIHDVDKLMMYMFLSQEESQKYHVMHRAHHLDNTLPKSYADYVETVIDFESAPYTKPDKPLNAYDFTKKLLELGYINKETADILFNIMHDLKIDYSYDATKNKKIMDYVNSIGEVTEEMILLEVFEYAHFFPQEIQFIKEKMELFK